MQLSSYIDYLQTEIVVVSGVDDREIAGVSNDSRKVKPGWIFVAISGAVDDGNRYIDRALAAGATAVISERELNLPKGIVAIQVVDAYSAAAAAAEVMYEFPSRKLELIGITGTNGKTTTAFLLREIFRLNGEKIGMVGTIGYDCGGSWEPASRTTPDPFVLQSLFARMLKNGCKRVILEVSSHAIVQNRLGKCCFQGAVFTNLSGDHLDYHKTMENYYLAKRQLFKEYLNSNAVVVVNGSDRYGRRLMRELAATDCQLISWGGFGREVDFRLRVVQEDLRGQTIQLTSSAGACRWRTPLLGGFNADNMAAAFLLARNLGITEDKILAAFANTSGVPGRLQTVNLPNNSLAVVDYAHTDDALLKVLQTLKRLPHRHLLLVFGCGGDRDREKRPRMGAVAAAYADIIILTNDNPRNEAPANIVADIRAGISSSTACEIIYDRHQAIETAVKKSGYNDILLLAGKGHEDYQEISGKRVHFDDLEELLRFSC